MKILNATCDSILQETLEIEMSNLNIVEASTQQKLQDELLNYKYDILLFKEDFFMTLHPLDFTKRVRENWPNIRIVFITTTQDSQAKNKIITYLNSKQVYDIIDDNDFGMDELYDALHNPKTETDILNKSKKISFDNEFQNLNDMTDTINNPNVKETNSLANIKVNYNDDISYSKCEPKTVAFWSAKGGAGVDTLAINSALTIAKYTDMQVCLVDLSENPNMHLYFNMPDTTKNIQQIFDTQINGMLNQYNIENYIIHGGETYLKTPNIHLIPGAISIINFYKKILKEHSNADVGKAFETILDFLSEKYSIVILILSPNITHIPTFAGLRKCSQINAVIENDVSNLYNTRRHIEPTYGLFNSFKIDKSKIHYIMNKYHVKDTFYTDAFSNVSGTPIEAYVELIPEELYQSIKSKNPLSLIVDNSFTREEFIGVANTILPIEILKPVEKTETKQKKEKKLTNFFKKNK